MGRIHSIEFHEQPWCPAVLRDAATDYLQFATTLGDPYAGIVAPLRAALERAGTREVLDLCSGGGGPWLGLAPKLAAELEGQLRVQLSDLHPNAGAAERALSASEGRIDYAEESVSAFDVPARLGGFRTLFAAFHHFRPADARRILQDAVDDGRGIAVVEPLGRSVPAILSVLFAPLVCWLVTPFIRPFRWSRLVFTYLVPIVPLIILWDGIVSCLRVYSPDELAELVSGLDAKDYAWQIDTAPVPRTPVSITYLIGHPPARA